MDKQNVGIDFWKILVPALIIVIGWWAGNWFSKNRDIVNKRREIISLYLIEAYRNLEDGMGRGESITEGQKRKMEKAIADVQLFGSRSEIESAKSFTDNMNKSHSGDTRELLVLLRKNLRKELKLEEASEDPKDIIHWRIK